MGSFLIAQNGYSNSLRDDQIDCIGADISPKVPDIINDITPRQAKTCIRKHIMEKTACACGDMFEKHNQLFPDEKETDEYKNKILKENRNLLVDALGTKLFNIYEMGIKADIMAKKGNLKLDDVYRMKECSTSSLKSSLQKVKELSDSRRCFGFKENLMRLTKEKDSSLSVDDIIKNYTDKIANITSKVIKNEPLKEGGMPLQSWYSIGTPALSAMEEASMMNYLHSGSNRDAKEERSIAYFPMEITAYSRYPESKSLYCDVFAGRGDCSNLTIWEKEHRGMADNPLLKMLINPPNYVEEREDDIAFSLKQSWKELSEEIKLGLYGDGSLDFMMNQPNDKERQRIIFDKISEKLKEKSVINNLLKATDIQCRAVYHDKNLEKALCNGGNALSKKSSMPLTASLLIEGDENQEMKMFFAAKANYELYCPNGIPSEDTESEIEMLTSPATITKSSLESFFDGENKDYEVFNENIASVLEEAKKEVNGAVIYDPEILKRRIPEVLTAMSWPNDKELSKADQLRRDSLLSSYTDMVSANSDIETDGTRKTVTFFNYMGNNSDLSQENITIAQNIASFITEQEQRIAAISGELPDEIVEQMDFSDPLARRPDNETGIFSSYFQRSNEEELGRARVIATEFDNAEREGREINQEVITNNSYNPRDITSGQVVEDAEPLVRTPINEVLTGEVEQLQPLASDTREQPLEANTESRSVTGSNNDSNNREDITQADDALESSQVASEEAVPQRSSSTSSSRTSRDVPTARGNTNSSNDLGKISNWNSGNSDLRDRATRAMEERQKRIDDLERSIRRDEKKVAAARGSEASKIRDQIYSAKAERNRLINQRNRRQNNSTAAQNIQAAFNNNRTSPHSDFGQENRFPSSIEDGQRTATSDDQSEEEKIIAAQKSGGKAAQSSASAAGASRGPASLSAGADNLKVKGFESKSLNDCYAPNLHYIYPCFIHVEVLKNIELVDDLDSREGRKALENPITLVHDFGLEGKMFAVVRELDDKNRDGEEMVEIISYDWTPPSEDFYTKMDDKEYRNSVIAEIYQKRWDNFFLRKEASKTGIYKTKKVTVKEFNQLKADRDTETIVEPTANHVITNVARMNLASREDNKDKIAEIYEETLGQ